ncbi:hypothetical protein ACKVWC_004211 [Pyricularia oryzae]
MAFKRRSLSLFMQGIIQRAPPSTTTADQANAALSVWALPQYVQGWSLRFQFACFNAMDVYQQACMYGVCMRRPVV